MIPCVPPASGRVPGGQEGRTMVFIEIEYVWFTCNVMILESSGRYMGLSHIRYSGVSPVSDMSR